MPEVEGIDGVAIKERIISSSKNDKLTRRMKNMINEELTPEIFPIVSSGYLYRGPYGTSHGSPYDYDTHVPLIFSRSQFNDKRDNSPRATVDIAPTIATYLNVDVPDYCDGKGIDL